MKKLLIAAILLLSGLAANAQNYDWSVGVRGGIKLGSLNARHCFSVSRALDLSGTFSFDDWGWELAGIYEWTQPVLGDGFEFYYGLGAQAGAFSTEEKDYIALGAVGVAGLEYSIPTIPLIIFIDYRPRLTCTVGQGLGLGYTDLGLGLRIRF